MRPSSGTETHLELYRRFPEIGSIVHTHSPWATIWAQLGRDIPPLGTTHADDFGAQILCTRAMEPEKIEGPYERNTGRVIAETLEGWEFRRHSGVLVRGHGPFVWESMPEKAVEMRWCWSGWMAWPVPWTPGQHLSPRLCWTGIF